MTVRYTPTPVPQDENEPLRAWLDGEHRRIAGSQPDEGIEGVAILFESADNVVANDVTETPIINYADSFANGVMAVDPVAGTITLPGKAGVVDITVWVSLNQVTATRNFTVQLVVEVNGSWLTQILSSGYIPQNGVSVALGLSAAFSREVAGGEVVRLGLLLDGATPATFAILDSTFEIRYLTFRG